MHQQLGSLLQGVMHSSTRFFIEHVAGSPMTIKDVCSPAAPAPCSIIVLCSPETITMLLYFSTTINSSFVQFKRYGKSGKFGTCNEIVLPRKETAC
jgi:hypothetical protein